MKRLWFFVLLFVACLFFQAADAARYLNNVSIRTTSWINGTNTSAASITGLPSGKDIIITALAGRWLTGGTSGAKGKFVIASGATVYCDFPMPGRFVDNNSYDNKDPFYLVLPTPIKIPSSAVNGLTLSWTPDGTDSATTYRFSIQYLEL